MYHKLIKFLKHFEVTAVVFMLWIIFALFSHYTEASSDSRAICNKVAQSFDKRVDVLTNPLVEIAIFTNGVYRCTVTYNKKILLGNMRFTSIPVIIILTYNPENRAYIYKTVR